MLSRETWIAPPLLLCALGCTKTDHVPAYIDLEPVTVATDVPSEGSGTHRITDLWVSAGGEDLGVWEVGSRIPALAEGINELRLIAGVPRNGVIDDRIQYPFYETFVADLDLAPEAHTDIAPVFTYFDDVQFFLDRFEPGGFQVDVEAESDTTLDLVTDPNIVLEGSGCARVALDTAHNFLRFVSFEAIETASGPVFLELDYKCDHRFLVGVYYTNSGGSVVRTPYLFVAPTLRADGGMPWNKIHIDLSSLFNSPGTSEKKFYIETYLEPGESSALVYFDNLKLVHL